MIIELWIVAGIVMSLVAAYYLYELVKYRHKSYLLYWNIISFLLSFFIAFFGFYSYFQLRKIDSKLIPLGVTLYFFAAIFVLFVVRYAYRIIFTLNQDEERYKDMVFKLEYESSEKNIELSKKVEELENSKSAMINILEDISEQKNRILKSEEEMMRLNRKLELSNRELLKLDEKKDQFTSITAHELKTPLASIHGFIQLLQKKEIFEDREKHDKYMKIILSDTERLTKLVTDILDISRLDIGTLKFYFENMELKDFLDSVEKGMEPIVNSKKLLSSHNIEADCPKEILSDKSRLSQVLINLITNAVHYTNEGGSICVNVKKEGDMVLFSVSDTGIGIPENEKGKIFERFHQVDSWLTRKIGGSGLGLAICKGIVEAMGGRIWLDSQESKGSTFYFTTPIKCKENTADKYEKYLNVFNNRLKDEGLMINENSTEDVKKEINESNMNYGRVNLESTVLALKSRQLVKPIDEKVADFFT